MGGLLILLGVVAALGGVVTVGLQGLWMLQDGIWTPESIGAIWLRIGLPLPSLPGMGSVGSFIFDAPFSAALIVIGAVLIWLGGKFADG
jgi:hypothetical protein